MRDRYDVAILGGGLAGLTLGLQLARERPRTSILIAGKRQGPAPEAAFKVGESTVELAAFYFAEVCGMKDRLEEAQLRKNGLRYFFGAAGNEDIARRAEWGTVELPPTPSCQIDRGRFENELTERNRSRDATDVLDGCAAVDVELRPTHGHRSRSGATAAPSRSRPAGSSTRPGARSCSSASSGSRSPSPTRSTPPG